MLSRQAIHFHLNDVDDLVPFDPGQRRMAVIYLDNQWLCRLDIVLHSVKCYGKGLEVIAMFIYDKTHDTFWHALWERQHRPAWPAAPLPTVIPRLPGRGLDTVAAQQERVAFLEESTCAVLEHVAHTMLEPERLANNIESFVGSVEVPIGVAGPLLLNGRDGAELVYAPFATSEGALVASATRGATAITHSGGAYARALDQRVMRTPSFDLPCLNDALFFVDWVEAHLDRIREQVGLASKHAELLRIEPELLGRQVHMHFIYKTGDAAGQNMVTACTWRACNWILGAIQKLPGFVVKNFASVEF